jgi:ABC-type nitrate/sulfonate/bicarbonate transport system ATPase subunit/ABC-type transporter Mla maintaining outer membrane lipid asymmetry permease subunit MlaE
MSETVHVEGLSVALPDGSAIIEDTDVLVRPGEILALLGPSGAGKTTLLRAIFAPEELKAKGYAVAWSSREVSATPAFVPQRGALLDHLDVAGNIALAQAGAGLRIDVETWIHAVDLDPSFALPGRSVAALSGGQAQRVAVARTLAAGRKLIVLDEPSVGLDPAGVRRLARLLVKQARQQSAGIILITHDLVLAGGASDTITFLDPSRRRLRTALLGWSGPAELDEPEVRRRRLSELESAVETLLDQPRTRGARAASSTASSISLFTPLRIAGEAILRFFDPRLMLQSLVVLRRALGQSLLRPLPFYAIVGALLGVTVPYVIVHISDALKPSAVLSLIGGSYILSLAPPLSAIVFAATSGSAVNAWLGGLRLNGQVVALEGLAVSPARYLWSPAWMALAWSYLVTLIVFTASMTAGGWALFTFYDVPHALSNLTADFLDPPPSRLPYLLRALWLAVTYAVAVASIVVAKGSEPKERSEQVTSAMTSAVMRATLFVVVMELATIVALFAFTWRGR